MRWCILTRILITNDDGIEAEGLKHLIEAMRPLGDIVVFAPATEQSGMGVSITFFSPLNVEKHVFSCETPGHKVHGTPADCVRLGLHLLGDAKPNLIVSGINRGANLGRYVLSSGTVGAVIEGAFRGIPGIAFSASNYYEPNYALFQKHARSIASHVLLHPLPDHTVLNVNFPKGESKGYRLTRQGLGHWNEELVVHRESSYIFQGSPQFENEHPHGEVFLLEEGYITASPIRIFELTHDEHLNDHKEHFELKLNVD
ncbi:MAG: 5'/3'-nucleotidase SurE [Chlamydiales bacterium]|nr:5'/3'-nucleotidase SurE [Chlamydiales bacterium]